MTPSIFSFGYKDRKVRVFLDAQGEPWWVAADICKILGLENTTRALEHVDDDERSQVIDPVTLNNDQYTGINNLLNVINESGLYSLILRSRKPEAKAVKRWITREVLPSLRKTGSYALPNAARPLPNGSAIALPKGVSWTRIASAHRAFFRMADDLGLRDEERVEAVHRAVLRAFGVDVAALFAPDGKALPALVAGVAVEEADGKVLPAGENGDTVVESGAVTLSDGDPDGQVEPTDAKAFPAQRSSAFGVKAVVSPDTELLPSKLGDLLDGMTGKEVNRMLCDLGYQVQREAQGHPRWQATEKGAPFAVLGSIQRSNGGGVFPHLFWKASILEELRPVMDRRTEWTRSGKSGEMSDTLPLLAVE